MTSIGDVLKEFRAYLKAEKRKGRKITLKQIGEHVGRLKKELTNDQEKGNGR